MMNEIGRPLISVRSTLFQSCSVLFSTIAQPCSSGAPSSVRSLDRAIYMDGRPHPPDWAPHTWSGFSTGRFEGNDLVITTTHLKESYIRRNGPSMSDRAKVTEWLSRHGDYLTVTTYIDDPIYL